MSSKVGNSRPKRQTKSERLADLCLELIAHVKKLGESQVKLYEETMTAVAQINILASALEVLKEKGLITDEEIKESIAKTKIQNAKQNESTKHPEGSDSGSEESGSEDEVHTDDCSEESSVPATESERVVDDDAS